ncbi:ATP-binding protein [Micromonospora sp. DT228]|uniref:ATP-binding protein n=1 Tax=Micromonospora sp. DT228 TaxID=3393443 RepID=UPI003CE8F31C
MRQDGDPVEVFRTELQELYLAVRRPTYRSLEAHADFDGSVLRISTVGDLLNGPGTPRWATVQAFVGACARHAHAHRITVPAHLVTADRWHARYRAMENALADRAVRAGARHAPTVRVAAQRRAVVVPSQLPADLPTFAGRTAQLAELDRHGDVATDPGCEHAGQGDARPAAAAIVAIDGTPGVGKTALAIRWAHRVADRFPDGQLYVNLHGFDPVKAATDPADAVRSFLDAFGVDPHRIPTTLDAQAALYRSLLSGRRMLIVLDNARDSEQVRYLLPGAPGCLVVVTSRTVLVGLLALNGAHPLTLDTLSDDEARTLLANRLGDARVAAEPDAVQQLITACARLPLALAVIAARAHRFGLPLAALAAELHETGQRLDVLDTGDRASQVRAVFSWSYQALSTPAALLFRMLGLHPGPDISISAAASLAGQSRAVARRSLTELAGANLVIEHVPGRYVFHDLLRAYAADQVHTIDSARERHLATVRLLDHYLHSGYAADRLLNPTREPISLPPARPGVAPDQLTSGRQALDWFAAEHAVLLAVVEHTRGDDFDTHIWQLAWVMWAFLYPRGYWSHWVAVGRAAVAAAARTADPGAQIHANRLLAHAEMQMSNFDESDALLRRTLDLAERAGDRLGQAHTQISLCYLADWRGQYSSALAHANHAHEMFRDLGYAAGQAEALTRISWSHAGLGEYQLALTCGNDALGLQQTLANREGQASTWHSMGLAHYRLGQYAQALTCYHHALALLQDLGNRFYEAEVLVGLGDTLHRHGDLQAACDSWRQALIILDDLHHARASAVRTRLRALAPPTVTPSE